MVNKKIIVAIPHSHSWFWTQTCAASLQRCPPFAAGYDVKIFVVDNSPWSPAIKGITETPLGNGISVVENYKSNKFHASALDCIVEKQDFDLLMALETDVLALKPGWLQWFVDQLTWSDYAVGMWHHEQFINPSCTLYRGCVLRDMLQWSSARGLYKVKGPQDELRWGPNFSLTAPLDSNLTPGVLSDPRDLEAAIRGFQGWVGGPFAEKRGWPEGTILKEKPSGQEKGPGWYEPGQQLHHWAVQKGFTYTVCPNLTTNVDNVPVQSMYGTWGGKEYGADYPPSCRKATGEMGYDHGRQLEAVELFGNAMAAHLWGGTRALDILKHPVTCQFVQAQTPGWLAREARFWKDVVPVHIQRQTLKLIREFGWHTRGQGSDHVSDRDREAAEFVRTCYKAGGVEW